MALLNRNKQQIEEQMLLDFYSVYPEINQNIGNPITHMIKVFAGISETLNYYTDRSLEESALSTANRDTSIASLVSIFNYRPRKATESTGSVTFTIDNIQTTNVIIPAGTVLLGNYQSTDIYFRTLSDIIITPGNTASGVSVQQGRKELIDTFTTVGGNYQKFLISSDLFNQDSLVVEVAGVNWQFKTSLIKSTGTDTHFTTFVSHDGTYILFGDSTYGAVISAGTEINIYGRFNGGSNTNIPASIINTIVDDTIGLETGNTISVTQGIISFVGGEDAETLTETKALAPQALSTLGNLISKEDYRIALSQISGVGKGFAWGERDEIVFTIANANRIRYTFITTDHGIPSFILKPPVQAALDDRKMIEVYHEFVDPIIKNLTITCNIKYLITSNQYIVITEIETALNEFFSVDNLEFGETIHYSDINRIITSVSGVDYITSLLINSGSVDITLADVEFTKINLITLSAI